MNLTKFEQKYSPPWLRTLCLWLGLGAEYREYKKNLRLRKKQIKVQNNLGNTEEKNLDFLAIFQEKLKANLTEKILRENVQDFFFEKAQIRYRSPASWALIVVKTPEQNLQNPQQNQQNQQTQQLEIIFEQKQRAVSPGQSIVFYHPEGQEEILLGGAVIG